MELTIEDLIVNCTNCEGNGTLENPAMKQNRGGYGNHLVYATPIDCDKCDGKGLILTADGKVLIEFFQLAKKKHFLY